MQTQGTGRGNEEGAIETKVVETVDNRTSAGQEEPTRENVGVIHLARKQGDSGTGDGILAKTTAAVTNTFKSAKDAIVKDKDTATK